jgi:3-carboxy-cis,cis-muconate cycloisomerase
MPQKQNPVVPSALVALGHQMNGLRATLAPATQHLHQRDGAAWFTEWMVLPQIALSTACALQHAKSLSQTMAPNPAAMNATLDDGLGLIHAEALSFALTVQIQRPQAQAEAKALCRAALDQNTPLSSLAYAAHPELPKGLFDAEQSLGLAPHEARNFVARAQAI